MKLDKPLELDFDLDAGLPVELDKQDESQNLVKQVNRLENLLTEKDIAIAQLLDYIKSNDANGRGRETAIPVDWISYVYSQRPLTQMADLSGSDKGFRKHLYTTVYQEFIRPGKVKALLEIGLLCHADQKVLGGGESFEFAPSLDMWCEYLPNAKIYGFDIQDFSQAKGDWTAIFRGDQSNRKDLKKIIEQESTFDVIIDDALHASKHQQVTFSFLFRHLKKGGVFIIEDLHFQPFDEPEETKTLDLLRRLSMEGVWASKHAMANEKKYIEENVKEVLFFDSMKLPRAGSRDAFCVVRKR